MSASQSSATYSGSFKDFRQVAQNRINEINVKSILSSSFGGQLDLADPKSLRVEVQGHLIEMELNQEGPKVYLTIGRRALPCFHFLANIDSHLGFLNRVDLHEECSGLSGLGPSQGGGSLLLDLADYLAETLGLFSVELTDAADVSCVVGDREYTASLTFLRAMQKGEGWYESRGYRPIPDDSIMDLYSVYRGKTDRILNEKIEDFLKDVNELKDIEIPDLIDKYCCSPSSSTREDCLQVKNLNLAIDKLSLLENKIGEYLRSPSEGLLIQKTTSHFLTWLWAHDCRYYVDLAKYFLPDIYSLGKNFQDIETDTVLSISDWSAPGSLIKSYLKK